MRRDALFPVLRTALELPRDLVAYHQASAAFRDRWTQVSSVSPGRQLEVVAKVSPEAPAAMQTIVLLHGFGIGCRYLLPLASELAAYGRVWAPELPGHGRSEHDVRPLTIPQFAHVLTEWMDLNQLSSVILAGHSMGAQIGVAAALLRPDLVAGLALIAPASDPSARSTGATVKRVFRSIPYERFSVAQFVFSDMVRAGPRLLFHELRQTNSYALEAVLGQIGVPLRVLHGSRDALIPQPWAETVTRIAKAPPPTVIPGWGHALPYDSPEGVAAVILDLRHEVGVRQRVRA